METRKDRHQILQDFSKETSKGFIEETYEVWGHMWTLRTLNDGEEGWSDKFVVANNATAMITTRRAAKLSASVQAFDGVPLEQLFILPEATEADRAYKNYILDDQVRKRFWYAEKMYEYLEEKPDDMIRDLYAKYNELLDRRKQVLDNLKNSLKRTPPPA